MFIVKDFPVRIITLSASHLVLFLNDLTFGIGLYSIFFSSLMLVLSFTFVPYIITVVSSDEIKNKLLINLVIVLALLQYFYVSIFTGLTFVSGIILIRLLIQKNKILDVEYQVSDSAFTLFKRSSNLITRLIWLLFPIINFCYLYFFYDIFPVFNSSSFN